MSESKTRMDGNKDLANCGMAMTALSLGCAFLLPGISNDEAGMFLAMAAVGFIMMVVGWTGWIRIWMRMNKGK